MERDNGLDVPPGDSRYRLRRVWLSDAEVQEYYEGFANEGLWPLCHRAHVRPVFRSGDFQTYWDVNGRFVDEVSAEVQTPTAHCVDSDYHFALAPQMARACFPASTIGAFWHIPWPTWQVLEMCPWRRALVDGLLGADVLGFQTPVDCQNFLATADRVLGARIIGDALVSYAGHQTEVQCYPTSIEWPSPVVAQAPSVDDCRSQLRRQLDLTADAALTVSVARLDYTKGIEETFYGIERLLESYPEFRGRLTHVQVAQPSRARLPAYRELLDRVIAVADRVNRRFGQGSYRPVVLLCDHHAPADVYRLLRAADVCYVGTLHDGMNLVAKEFVAARDDEQGVLVLSAFTGAAWQLTDALIVNPYDLVEVAETLVRALTMSIDEQREQMKPMRCALADNNAHKWAARVLGDLARLRLLRQPQAEASESADRGR